VAPGWLVDEDVLDAVDVADLLALHHAEMTAGSPPDACHVLAVDGLRDQAVRTFAVRDGDGTLLGVGALKALEPENGEVKSMRTAPAALGRGVGRALLDHLVTVASAAGMARLSLETGSGARFAAAVRLYETAGFERCGPFGGYPDTPFTRFYTRVL
jgi:putative acetyltransferase